MTNSTLPRYVDDTPTYYKLTLKDNNSLGLSANNNLVHLAENHLTNKLTELSAPTTGIHPTHIPLNSSYTYLSHLKSMPIQPEILPHEWLPTHNIPHLQSNITTINQPQNNTTPEIQATHDLHAMYHPIEHIGTSHVTPNDLPNTPTQKICPYQPRAGHNLTVPILQSTIMHDVSHHTQTPLTMSAQYGDPISNIYDETKILFYDINIHVISTAKIYTTHWWMRHTVSRY